MDRILLLLLNFVILTAGQITPEEWTIKDYPNPVLGQTRECGRFKRVTSQICDPNQIITPDHADQLERLIGEVANTTKCPCSQNACMDHNFGFQIGIALVKSMEKTDREMEDMKDMNKQEQASYLVSSNLNKAALFSYGVMLNWPMGKCNETLVIFYSQDDNTLYTSVGKTTRDRSQLTDNDMAMIQMAHRSKFGRDQGQIFEGLKEIIEDYRLALVGEYDSGIPNEAPYAAAWRDSSSHATNTHISISMLIFSIFLVYFMYPASFL